MAKRKKQTTAPQQIQWQAESLRMTVFLEPQAPRPQIKTWRDLVGTPPEEQHLQRSENLLVEQGRYKDRLLQLTIQPPRVDWKLLPLPPEAEEPETPAFRIMGPWAESVRLFVPLMHQWFGENQAIARLAFGAVLLQPIHDLATGYRTLQGFLPAVTLDPPGSSDFLYKINRPRHSTSGIANLQINRLCTWSVAMHRKAGMDLSLDGIGRIRSSPVTFACRLELDINTAPDFGTVLPAEQLGTVFDELVKLAQEIANQGDIA